MKVPVFADILTAAQSSTGQLECLPMYYGGKWHEAADGATFESFGPGTGAPWAEIVEAGPEDVALAVTAARQAFENCWEMLSPADRARVLWKIARIVDEHRHELAVIESADNGKALRETEAELDLIVRYFEFFGGVAQCVNGDTLPRTGSALTYTRREPIGVVGAVIPWNSPLVMLAW